MGVHHPNAGLGLSVCGIAARHDQGEVAAVTLGESKLNPKHGKRLEEARDLQLAGIDGVEADIRDDPQHAGPAGPATNMTVSPAGNRGRAITLTPVPHGEPGEAWIDLVGRVDDDLAGKLLFADQRLGRGVARITTSAPFRASVTVSVLRSVDRPVARPIEPRL
jgi:hypothetical protein